MRGIPFIIAALILAVAASEASAQAAGAKTGAQATVPVAWLGLSLRNGQPPTIGAVAPGSPAAKAGLHAHDQVVKVGNQIATLGRFDAVSRTLRPGDKVKLRTRRQGRERDVWLTAAALTVVPVGAMTGVESFAESAEPVRQAATRYLTEACEGIQDFRIPMDSPDSASRGKRHIIVPASCMDAAQRNGGAPIRAPGGITMYVPLHDGAGWVATWGLELATVTPTMTEYFPGVTTGLLVLQTVKGLSAHDAGLQSGDVIVSLAGRAATSIDALDTAARDRTVSHSIEVVRHGRRMKVEIRPPHSTPAPAR